MHVHFDISHRRQLSKSVHSDLFHFARDGSVLARRTAARDSLLCWNWNDVRLGFESHAAKSGGACDSDRRIRVCLNFLFGSFCTGRVFDTSPLNEMKKTPLGRF